MGAMTTPMEQNEQQPFDGTERTGEAADAEKIPTPQEKKTQQREEAAEALRKIKPWGPGAASRTDKALMLAILGVTVFGMAMWPARPFLLGSNPVLLEFLTGSKAAVGAGAAFARVGEVSLALVVFAGVVGMIKFDWLFWWAGRQWGRGIVNLFAQTERSQRFAEKIRTTNPWWIRLAVVFAFVPGVPAGLVYALAGWTGMRLTVFMVLNAVGSLIIAGIVAGLGYALGQYAVDAVMAIDQYAIWISVGLALVVAFVAQREANAKQRRSS